MATASSRDRVEANSLRDTDEHVDALGRKERTGFDGEEQDYNRLLPLGEDNIDRPSGGFHARAIRLYLWHQVAFSTQLIRFIQRWRTPCRDAYFVTFSFLGDKLLYTCLLPYFIWIVNPEFGNLFLLLLIIETTLGNFLKNLLALPRPPFTALWVHTGLEDYGIPSTHSINATSMSSFLIYWFWEPICKNGLQYIVVVLAAWYIISMPLSRMYLGAHSHVDIIAGLLLGVLFFLTWIKTYDALNDFLKNYWQSPLIVAFVLSIFIFIHPRSVRPSPSHRHSAALTCLAYGAVLGMNKHVPFSSSSEHNWWSSHRSLAKQNCTGELADLIIRLLPASLRWLLMPTVTFVAGIVLLLGVYVTAKLVFRFLFAWLLKRPNIRSCWCWLKQLSEKYSVPSFVPLDNFDYPQWHLRAVVAGGRREDAKVLGSCAATVLVGYAVTGLVPLWLDCLGFVRRSHLVE